MKAKLKPCPFCGSKNLNFDSSNSIECKKCTGQVCLLYGDEQDTIDAWNKRTQSKVQEP